MAPKNVEALMKENSVERRVLQRPIDLSEISNYYLVAILPVTYEAQTVKELEAAFKEAV